MLIIMFVPFTTLVCMYTQHVTLEVFWVLTDLDL